MWNSWLIIMWIKVALDLVDPPIWMRSFLIKKEGLKVVFQIMLNSIVCSFRSIADIKLRKDAANVIANSSLSKKEHLSDLTVCSSFGNKLQYMHLLLGEFCKCRGFLFTRCFPDFLEHSLSDGWIK